jgi:cellulose synthase/poly-beta-1,6-N-acetylglucosamine synthase-like glycosyltransferase
MEALLFTPNSVAGVVVGYTANSAGNKIRPPPPTIESIKPAKNEATVINNKSMAALSLLGLGLLA